jgi:hypothetical protein
MAPRHSDARHGVHPAFTHISGSSVRGRAFLFVRITTQNQATLYDVALPQHPVFLR